MKKILFQKGHVKARAEVYPPLADFADAYYWQERGDPKPMKKYLARIDAIKAKYKKPDD